MCEDWVRIAYLAIVDQNVLAGRRGTQPFRLPGRGAVLQSKDILCRDLCIHPRVLPGCLLPSAVSGIAVWIHIRPPVIRSVELGIEQRPALRTCARGGERMG